MRPPRWRCRGEHSWRSLRAVATDKDSGIRNDPDDWAREHRRPRYILDLLLSVITLSLKTQEIVAALPSPTL